MLQMIQVLPIDEIEQGGTNVPVTELPSIEEFNPPSEGGASRYLAPLPDGLPLEALLVNKQSDLLVVSLHGATDRKKYSIPRFEWLKSLLKTEYSALYLSDPTLHLREDLELAWYTGSADLDLYPILAEWACRAADAVRAKGIIFLGSSGGGMAALQTATHIPGSMALAFSCQTSIANYLVAGTQMGSQRAYVEIVMPHLAPDGVWSLKPDVDWSVPLGERSSALVRYGRPQQNFVHYVQNTRDYPHVEQHYQPFRDVIEAGPNRDRVRFRLYEGPETHNPPWPDVFHSQLEEAAGWLRQTL
jgi:pimeloyl-ACP methyl ester carboxylesterase